MNAAIKIENLSKRYKLGTIGAQTLKGDIQRLWYKIRGKEDPLVKFVVNNNLDNVEGEYVWALRDINLEIKQGEVVGIIGKNGAGKSTLLKIISRITTPTEGVVKVKGRVASLLEVGTGFHPELTGRENIYLNGAILGMTKEEIRRKFDDIVDFAGIAKYIDTPVKRYSSGMYVRLGFAVAAHLDPDILIVDEVLAVGDAEFQKRAIAKMQEISKGEGRTVLFVSHNMASVRALCPTSILLQNGYIVFKGESLEAINFYTRKNEKHNGIASVVFEGPLKDIIEFKSFMINGMNPFETDVKCVMYQDIVFEIVYSLKQRLSFDLILAIYRDESRLFNVEDNSDGYFSIGVYKSKIVLPGYYLNKGYYSISLGVLSRDNDDWLWRYQFVSFEVIQNTLYQGSNDNILLNPKVDFVREKIDL